MVKATFDDIVKLVNSKGNDEEFIINIMIEGSERDEKIWDRYDESSARERQKSNGG